MGAALPSFDRFGVDFHQLIGRRQRLVELKQQRQTDRPGLRRQTTDTTDSTAHLSGLLLGNRDVYPARRIKLPELATPRIIGVAALFLCPLQRPTEYQFL
jgi:hypothetical protein